MLAAAWTWAGNGAWPPQLVNEGHEVHISNTPLHPTTGYQAVSREFRGYGSCRGVLKVAPAPSTVIESADVVISGSCRGAPNVAPLSWTSMTRFPGNAWP